MAATRTLTDHDLLTMQRRGARIVEACNAWSPQAREASAESRAAHATGTGDGTVGSVHNFLKSVHEGEHGIGKIPVNTKVLVKYNGQELHTWRAADATGKVGAIHFSKLVRTRDAGGGMKDHTFQDHKFDEKTGNLKTLDQYTERTGI